MGNILQKPQSAQQKNVQQLLHALPWLAVAAIAGVACTLLYLSLNHPINADLAMLHYSGWLMNEKDFVLYRDIFEINFPAPFLLHQLLGKLVGYDAAALRAVDLFAFGLLGFVSWKILQPVSRASAMAAPCLFAVFYWVNGGEFILEREFIGLIAASSAFLIATSCEKNLLAGSVLTGITSGIAISIKPNFLVMLPALFIILWHRKHLADRTTIADSTWKLLTALLFTSGIVSIAPFFWIYYKGGLEAFIHIYKTFLPIYTRCRYDLWHYDSDAERTAMLVSNFLKFARLSLSFALPGLVWAWLCNEANAQARQRILHLALMVFAFIWYELIAGKFWLSHLLPTIYWSVLGFSLLLSPVAASAQIWKKLASIAGVCLFTGFAYLFSQLSLSQMQAAHDTAQNSVSRSQKIADYLKQNLQPGDTVQTLDMAGDGQAALLAARATSASRHLIDVPLYMEPESADTKALRQELVDTLQQKPAAYIVYIQNFLHPGGGNRLREYKALNEIIEKDYDIGLDGGDNFTVYRRRPHALGKVTPR
ncbi:MAG TPA: hypothetical protein PLF22_07835 [Pseudomonadales bacterium]|nr:hypothetical protein [Pseudomonadales bacterium]